MASITFDDLPKSELLDRAAMGCLRGAAGEGNWVLGAFPAYVAPIAQGPGAMQVFNYMQQITNNYTYVGQMISDHQRGHYQYRRQFHQQRGAADFAEQSDPDVRPRGPRA